MGLRIEKRLKAKLDKIENENKQLKEINRKTHEQLEGSALEYERVYLENERLKEALQEASNNFYYIHKHPGDAEIDSYRFMNKVNQSMKGAGKS